MFLTLFGAALVLALGFMVNNQNAAPGQSTVLQLTPSTSYPAPDEAREAYPAPLPDAISPTALEPIATATPLAIVGVAPYAGIFDNVARPATLGRIVSGIYPDSKSDAPPFEGPGIRGSFNPLNAWMCECGKVTTIVWAGRVRTGDHPDSAAVVIQEFDTQSRKGLEEPVLIRVEGDFGLLKVLEGDGAVVTFASNSGRFLQLDLRSRAIQEISLTDLPPIRHSSGLMQIVSGTLESQSGFSAIGFTDVSSADGDAIRLYVGGAVDADGAILGAVAITDLSRSSEAITDAKLVFPSELEIRDPLWLFDVRGNIAILEMGFGSGYALLDLNTTTLVPLPLLDPVTIASGLFSPVWLSDEPLMRQLPVFTPFPTESFRPEPIATALTLQP